MPPTVDLQHERSATSAATAISAIHLRWCSAQAMTLP